MSGGPEAGGAPEAQAGGAPEAQADGGGRRALRAGVAVLLGGLLVRLASDTVADPDLWGHVRFGRLALRLGGPARIDPFSYLTAGHGWINHEWLSEVLMAGAWDRLGTAGLVGLKALLLVALVAFLYAWLRRSGVSGLRAGLLALALSLPALGNPGTVRPHLFTYAGFALTLAALVQAGRGRGAWLWILPPLFALWVNLHGGVLAGLGVVLLWALVRAAAFAVRRVGRRASADPAPGRAPFPARSTLVMGSAVVAACGALLLNPYGVRLPLFLLRTATVARPDISEWQPVRIASGVGLLYVVLVVLAARTAVRARRGRRPEILALLGVTALLPLMAIRHLPLFGIAVGVLLADAFASAPDTGPLPGPAPGRSSALRTVAGVAAGLIGLLAAASARPSFSCIDAGPPRSLPVPARAVSVLRASGARGHLAVFFDWGEYAIWHLAPTLRVGMDGRRETVYPDSIYSAYQDWMNGAPDWKAYLSEGPADVALVPTGSVAANLMGLDPAWALGYADRTATVFARSGSAAAAAIRRAGPPRGPADGRGTCFP